MEQRKLFILQVQMQFVLEFVEMAQEKQTLNSIAKCITKTLDPYYRREIKAVPLNIHLSHINVLSQVFASRTVS